MTDESILRASIKGKVVSWYPLDGNLNDVAGGNDLSVGLSVAGYASGKQGQMLLKNSLAAVLLENPFPLTTNNAISIGGWIYYDGTADARNLFGLTFDLAALNSAFGVGVNAAGDVRVNGYPDGAALYGAQVPGFTVRQFPITVRVTDSVGNKATSDQVISVDGFTPTNGFYFVVARYVGQTIEIFTQGKFSGASTPPMPAPRSDLIKYFQLGQQFGSTPTNCGLDEVFFCQAALTDEEILWLYNDGDGRSYFELG